MVLVLFHFYMFLYISQFRFIFSELWDINSEFRSFFSQVYILFQLTIVFLFELLQFSFFSTTKNNLIIFLANLNSYITIQTLFLRVLTLIITILNYEIKCHNYLYFIFIPWGKQAPIRHKKPQLDICLKKKRDSKSLDLSKIDSNKQLLILDACSFYVFMCLSMLSQCQP